MMRLFLRGQVPGAGVFNLLLFAFQTLTKHFSMQRLPKSSNAELCRNQRLLSSAITCHPILFLSEYALEERFAPRRPLSAEANVTQGLGFISRTRQLRIAFNCQACGPRFTQIPQVYA